MPGVTAGAPAAASFSWRSLVAVWAAFAAGLVLLAAHDGPGWGHAPVYRRYLLNDERPIVPVTVDHPLTVELDLERRPPPASVVFAAFVDEGRVPLRVRVEDARSGERLGAAEVRSSGANARVSLDTAPEPGARLRIVFESDAVRRPDAPGIGFALEGPGFDVAVVSGRPGTPGAEVLSPFRGPLLLLEYPALAPRLLLAWLLVPLGLASALRRPALLPLHLLVLALAAAVTSVALWEAHASVNPAQADPDAYGRCAESLVDWLRRPAERPAIEAFFREHPHTHTLLGSALLAVPLLLGAPVLPAYVVLSGLASCAALLLFVRTCARRLGATPATCALAAVLFAASLLGLRAFARPGVDPLGLLLVVVNLDLVLARLRGRRAGQVLVQAILVALHLLARPQGPAVVALSGLGWIAADALRDGFRRLRLARSAAAAFLAPALVVMGAYAALGWFENVEIMMRKAAVYERNSTWPNFLWSVGAAFTLLPLLWAAGGRALRRAPYPLFLGWCALYVAVLVAVRAPYWSRHFLPVLPFAVALALPALDAPSARTRVAARLGACAVAVGCVGVVVRMLAKLPEMVWPRLLD